MNTMRNFIIPAIGFALLVSPSAASAGFAPSAALQSACRGDAFRLCSGSLTSMASAIACLRQRSLRLAPNVRRNMTLNRNELGADRETSEWVKRGTVRLSSRASFALNKRGSTGERGIFRGNGKQLTEGRDKWRREAECLRDWTIWGSSPIRSRSPNLCAI